MRRILLPLLIASTWLTTDEARACSCDEPATFVEAYEDSAIVFEGFTSEPVPDGWWVRYTFEVARTFKGSELEVVDIMTRHTDAECGVSFEPGEPYLIYARFEADEFRVSMCSRSSHSDRAVRDIEAFEAADGPLIAGRGGCSIADQTTTAVGLLLLGLIAARRRRSP